MSISNSLYKGQRVRLAPIDHEKDIEIMARWTHDPRYTRLLEIDPVRPRSQAQIKKQLEGIEKDSEESKNLFYFTVRTLPGGEEAPERLIGFMRIFWIVWSTGVANIELGIGDPRDWGRGYGKDTLHLGLRFAFDELNLYRLHSTLPEYNTRALRLLEGAGFTREICRRQAVERDGARWDKLTLGLLRSERALMREQEVHTSDSRSNEHER